MQDPTRAPQDFQASHLGKVPNDFVPNAQRPSHHGSEGLHWYLALEALADGSESQCAAGDRLRAADREAMGRALAYWRRGSHIAYLAQICSQLLWDQACLIDHEFHRERTTVLLARETVLSGASALESTWVAQLAEEALQDILAEAESGGFLGEFGGTPTASPYGGLMQQFGLDEDQARLGAVRFHRLDLWTRRAFCALLIDRQSVEECLELGFGPIERLQSSVRMAMKALLGLSDLWPELEPELEPLDGWVAGEDLHGEV